MVEIESFIVKQLETAGIYYNIRGNDIYVSCPFHTHRGFKLKLGFALDSPVGAMHCWVCKTNGSWNTYAEKMGLQKLSKKHLLDFQIVSTLKQIERLFTPELVHRLPPGVTPWEGSWRKLPEWFLSSVPSLRYYDAASKIDRILWPVVQNGRLFGNSAALIDPTLKIQPKTRSLSGFDARLRVFPFDHYTVKSSDRIVLVEGQYDALRLVYHGLPAVCTFGTSNWNSAKLNLILGRRPKRVVLAFDADKEGQSVADVAFRQFIEAGVDVRRMAWPDVPPGARDQFGRRISSYDPGSCTTKSLLLLHRLLDCA